MSKKKIPVQETAPDDIPLRFPYAWIILAGLLVYFQVVFFDFSYLDDNTLILDQSHFLKNWATIPLAFTQDVFRSAIDAYYRPILTVSFMLDNWIGGGRPWIYHLSNIVLHLINGCLLFALLRRLKHPAPLSLAAALLFTVHPVLTQATAWIPGRNDSLLAVFILAGFLSLLRYTESGNLMTLALHVLFFALSMFTKETALALIPMMVFYFWILRRDRFKALILPACFWAATLAIWFVLRNEAFSHPLRVPSEQVLRSMAANSPALLLYLGKAVFPFNLTVLPILQDSSTIYGIAALVLVTALLLFSKHKRPPLVFFGAAWFLLFLLPSLIRPDPHSVADFIEHRIYVPLIGFLILLLEIDWLRSFDFRKAVHWLSAAAVLLLFAGITVTHAREFQDRMTFWRNAAAGSPHCSLAHKNLGAMYHLEGKLDVAEAEYRKVLELNPDEEIVRNNLGLIYASRGRFQEAEREYREEIRINPLYPVVYYNYGLLLHATGRDAESEAFWKKAIEINPDDFGSYYRLSVLYRRQRRETELPPILKNLERLGVGSKP